MENGMNLEDLDAFIARVLEDAARAGAGDEHG
jgi:hypothetical protein